MEPTGLLGGFGQGSGGTNHIPAGAHGRGWAPFWKPYKACRWTDSCAAYGGRHCWDLPRGGLWYPHVSPRPEHCSSEPGASLASMGLWAKPGSKEDLGTLGRISADRPGIGSGGESTLGQLSLYH